MYRKTHGTRMIFLIAILLFFGGLRAVHASTTLDLDIPAQSLADALSALSLQSGTPLSYEGDLARNIQSPPLRGAYTTEAALDKLLARTGLGYRRTENAAIVVAKQEARPEEPSKTDSANTDRALATVKVTGSIVYDENDPDNPTTSVPMPPPLPRRTRRSWRHRWPFASCRSRY